MTSRARSRKEELAHLRDRLRRQGWTYERIAARIRVEHGVNIRVAFRLAHGLTQQQVADRWNTLWPGEDGPKTGKHISYWEAWPAPSGRTPSLATLGRLAAIYACRPGDLLDAADYPPTRVDAPTPPDSRSDSMSGALLRPVVAAPVAPAGTAGGSLLRPEARDCLKPAAAPYVDTRLVRLTDHLAAMTTIADSNASLSARQRDVAFHQMIDFFVSWAQTMNRRVLLRQHRLGRGNRRRGTPVPRTATRPAGTPRHRHPAAQPCRRHRRRPHRTGAVALYPSR